MKAPEFKTDFEMACADVRRWHQSETYHPSVVPAYIRQWPKEVIEAAEDVFHGELLAKPCVGTVVYAGAIAALLVLFFLAGFWAGQ